MQNAAGDMDFVQRILDYRVRGSAARAREQETLASEARAMSGFLGGLSALCAMDSDAFPVAVHEVSVSADIEFDMPESGGRFVVLRREGDVSQVYASFRTREGDHFANLHLHPASGEAGWTLETSFRGTDGSEDDERSRFGSAREAVTLFRRETLSTVMRALSGDRRATAPPLHEEDGRAAAAIARAVREALASGKTLEAARRQHREEILRSGGAVRAAWEAAASSLAFLKELGYAVGSDGNGLGLTWSPTQGGLEVRIASGENWSRMYVDATPSDPATAEVRVEDSVGRREFRGYFPVADASGLADEMKNAVMDEIEAAESVYAPRHDVMDESFPSM